MLRRERNGRVANLFRCGGGVTMAALTAVVGLSQEALRPSLAGEAAASQRRLEMENQPYNFKIGRFSALIDSSLSLEWNDNVNLAEGNRQEDVILKPQFHAYSFWPITTKNALNLDLGVGYVKYVKHPEYDRLLIQPGSELSLDLFVGDFKGRSVAPRNLADSTTRPGLKRIGI